MRTTRVSPFGPEYEQLLLTAFANLPFPFPMQTSGHAKAFKAKVYQYFRTLRAENLRLDLIEMADQIALVVQDSSLLFQAKEDTWDNAMIRENLGLAKGFYNHGNTDGVPGAELQLPDLLQNRLMRKVSEIRERKAGSARVVTPYKLSK